MPATKRFSPLHIALLVTAAILLLGVGFAAGAGAMWFLGPNARAANTSSPEGVDARAQSANLLANIWDLLDREYIEPQSIVADKMMDGAARGMVESLGDPHTMYVEPDSAAVMDEDMQGRFEGIGATVELVEERVTIVRPLPGSPALAAGLLARDIIATVDGQSLQGKTIIEAISLIRGPEGTSVKLGIERQGSAPFEVTITRAKLELPNIESKVLDGQVAYVRLSEFNALAGDQVHKALRELLAQDPVGLVFDLRDNPGGYLHIAIEIAGEFLPEGALVVQEQERDQPLREDRVSGRGLAREIPLVVLVNEGSASASEIVAGAIQQNGRARLLGATTYGKGSVQRTHELENGGSLRVTIAKWLLPDGSNLDGQGIAPDIEVTLADGQAAASADPQLDRAVQYLLEDQASHAQK